MAMDIVQFPTKKMIHIIADMLESLIQANNRMLPNSQITHFDSRTIPNISLVAYIERLQRFAYFSNEALLSMLIYFDRISSPSSGSNSSDSGFIIHSYNVHRLIIASLVVASKFTSDVYYTNTRYAKVGGISVAELNQLELEFLFLIKFRLHIEVKKLQSFADRLLLHSLRQQNHHLQQQQQQQQHHRKQDTDTILHFNETTESKLQASIPMTSPDFAVSSPTLSLSSTSPTSTGICKEIEFPLTPPPCDSISRNRQSYLYRQQQQQSGASSMKRKRDDDQSNVSREKKKAAMVTIHNATTMSAQSQVVGPNLTISIGVISPKDNN